MTYDDIQKANAAIKTVNISGKQYAEVKERIKAFRMLCPDGYIKTHVELLDEDTCMATAEVGQSYPEGDRIYGTGTAMEVRTASRINQVSFIENAETSAVGRALGMLGLGITGAVASAEEMTKVERATERQVGAILKIYQKDDAGLMELMDALKISDIEAITAEQAGEVLSMSKMHNWTPLTADEVAKVRRRKR